jgi:hypothetical protein
MEKPMNPEIEAQINDYLSDETKLYQEWYSGLRSTDKSQYTKQVSVIPPLAELKHLCESWINQQKPVLQNKLCPSYCQRLQQLQEHEPLLIAAIADILTIAFTGIPLNSIAVAVILVTINYLEQFCECAK